MGQRLISYSRSSSKPILKYPFTSTAQCQLRACFKVNNLAHGQRCQRICMAVRLIRIFRYINAAEHVQEFDNRKQSTKILLKLHCKEYTR